MDRDDRNAWLALPAALLVGVAFAAAGSDGGRTLGGMPIFALTVILVFLAQWAVFLPSYLARTEKFFDLTGSLTYIAAILFAFLASPEKDARSLILTAMVVLWAARLGAFLFQRIHKAGKDSRFDDIKQSFSRFLAAWTLQGLWITFTMAAALAAVTSSQREPLGPFALVGGMVWLLGISLEAIADHQKKQFKANPDNEGKFIDQGLWSRSRHPNYFGEIVLWTGVAIISIPVLQDWQYLALSSPALVALLLMRVSGVPMLEKRSDEKWGGQPDYERYKEQTPVLIPRLTAPKT